MMSQSTHENDRPYTVFVLDDDQAVCDSLKFLLESAGHPVLAYTEHSELLSQVTPEAQGCLIVDLRLPGTSGIDIYQQLTESGINLPTIMITGHGDVPVAVRDPRRYPRLPRKTLFRSTAARSGHRSLGNRYQAANARPAGRAGP